MNINETNYEEDIFKYIKTDSRLENLLLSSFTKDMIHSAMHQTDYVYVNGGPYVPKHESTSKTAIAHKILFDSSSDNVKFFSKGFHKNIFGEIFVIEACMDFIKRAMRTRTDKSKPIIEIIAKEHDSRLRSCLEESTLFQKIKNYEKVSQETILSIKQLEPTTKITSRYKAFVVENGDQVEIDVINDESEEKIVSNINTFSIFDGKTFRYKKDVNSNHKAYINFGASDVAKKFVLFYDELSVIAEPIKL